MISGYRMMADMGWLGMLLPGLFFIVAIELLVGG